MTGTMHMDYSDAAGTLLLDAEKKEWSKPILEKFRIPAAYLPELIGSSGTDRKPAAGTGEPLRL